MRLRVEHAPRFGSDHSRLVLEIDTERFCPPPASTTESIARKEEESQEAAKFRALTTPLLGEWRHGAEASKNQWGSQPWVDAHFRKLEEMLTKAAKECLGVTRRWSRNKKGRSRGEAEEELHNRAKEQEEEWASSWGVPEPKRRRIEKNHGGEDAHAEPRLRELVRQGHLRLKEEEKERSKRTGSQEED